MKNIRMRLATIIGTLALVFVYASCSEGLLDQDNANTVSAGTFWQNPDDVEKAINGMYHPITNTFFWGRIIHTGAMLRSDEFNVRPFGVNTAMSTFQGTPGVARWSKEIWEEPFKTIFRANAILENVNSTNVPDQAQRDGFVGQAYFMRGFANWYLVNLYGNIPLITVVPQDDAEFFPAQTTPSEVWAQIISDFEMAESLLPSSWSGNDIGRPTSGAATAFKGKSYLYTNQWAPAETAFRSLVGQYSLLPAAMYGDNFGQVRENNMESVFELQYLGQESFAWGVDIPSVGTMGNFHIDYAPPEKSPDQSHFINSWIKDLFEANGETIRRDATIAYDYPGATGYGGVPFLTDFAGDIAVATTDGMEPIFSRKYAGLEIGTREEVDFLGTNVGNNWRIIRYADVLLMLAEAINEQPGGADEAAGFVNMVRSRAMVTPLGMGMTQDQMRQKIIDERVLELTGEGHRFFDLVRWGLADDYLGASSLHGAHPKSLTDGVFQSNKHELLWIPQSEIDANSNLEQNPGY